VAREEGHLLLSEHGYRLLRGFREPLTAAQSVERLSLALGLDGRDASAASSARATIERYVRAGLLKPAELAKSRSSRRRVAA